MACALEPVDGEEIHAELHGGLGVPDRGAFVQDGAVGGFELRNHGTRAVSGGLDDAHAFVDDDAGVSVVVRGNERGEEGYVDGEGRFGHGAAAADLFTEVFWSRLGEGRELRERERKVVTLAPTLTRFEVQENVRCRAHRRC